MTTTFLSATGQPGHKRLRLTQLPECPAPHPFVEWLVRPVGVEGAESMRFGSEAEAVDAAGLHRTLTGRTHFVVVVTREV